MIPYISTSLPKNTPGFHIINYASQFVGLKEIPNENNREWLELKNGEAYVDTPLVKKFTDGLKSVGWVPGLPYCMFFAKMCYYQGHLSYINTISDINDKKRMKDMIDSFNTFLTSSTLATYNKLNTIDIIFEKPEPGSIVLMRNVKQSNAYHAGILTNQEGDTIYTIEGNTFGIDENNKNERFEGIDNKKRSLNGGTMIPMGFFNPLSADNLNYISLKWKELYDNNPSKFDIVERNFKKVVTDPDFANAKFDVKTNPNDKSEPSLVQLASNLADNLAKKDGKTLKTVINNFFS